MSITSHPKIFYKSKCRGKDGATIEASTGDASSEYAIDQNIETKWRSSGSDDLTAETITVTFEQATIDRIFLIDHNLKNFVIQYDLSGSWTHLASVVGIDGSMANITETTFADDTAYYEFTPVTTTKIRITANTTQTVDAEKYIGQIVVTEELGTFAGWPKVKETMFDRNNRVRKMLNGFYQIQKSLEVPSFDIEFKDYPATSTYSVDIDLLLALHDSEEPFLVWLCGGVRGSNYFRYTNRGYRLKDLFQMQVSKAIKMAYNDNVYTNQISAKFELEAVL